MEERQGEGHAEIERGTGEMPPPAKGYLGLLEEGRGKEGDHSLWVLQRIRA